MTIKQIAEKANVSIATVDRVIHKRGRVAKKTRDIILSIIKQSGYKKNIFASNLKLQKTFNVAVLMPEIMQESKYWETSKNGIIKALMELTIYKLKADFFYFDRFSSESFDMASKNIYGKHYDGIIMAPVNEKKSLELLKRIPNNTPYVFFNTDLPGAMPVCFIGQDSFGSGVVAARLMKEIINERGEIAIIQASEDEFHHASRANGFLSFFERSDLFDIKIYRLHGNTEKEPFISLMDDIVTENKSLKGIFVTSASCHYAAEYLNNSSVKNKIRIIGYDLVEENIKYLNEGGIDILISQKPEDQGYRAVYSLFRKLVLHENPDRKIMMPVDIIIRENLNQYLASDR